MGKTSVYTVEKVNQYIQNMFKQDYMLISISVKGEVSNCKYHSSGHIYFTLKDNSGVLSCVMFASHCKGLNFTMINGQEVVVTGRVDVYPRDGKYQMYATDIVLSGQGDLYEKFDAMRRELEEMGLFHQSYKQPIPKYIQTLGVVTAQTGAVVSDISVTAANRNPYVQIILYPAIVQGEGAAASIVAGIQALEARGVDTIIIGRGGGSIEELWAFNEREVAQAIFDCSIPIISAVGHETDYTIADFVADERVATPTAAAQLAVYQYEELVNLLGNYEHTCEKLVQQKVVDVRHQLERMELQLDKASPAGRLREQKGYLVRLEERMQECIKSQLTNKKHALLIAIERMKGLSPLDKLGQGYSYLTTTSGQPIRSIDQVAIEEQIQIQMLDGSLSAIVERKRRIERKLYE